MCHRRCLRFPFVVFGMLHHCFHLTLNRDFYFRFFGFWTRNVIISFVTAAMICVTYCNSMLTLQRKEEFQDDLLTLRVIRIASIAVLACVSIHRPVFHCHVFFVLVLASIDLWLKCDLQCHAIIITSRMMTDVAVGANADVNFLVDAMRGQAGKAGA